MNKNKFFNIFFGVVAGIYAILLLLNALQINSFTWIETFWFPTFLLFMACVMIMRAILFKSDSSSILGVSLGLNAILFFIRSLYALSFWQILPIFISTFCIACGITWIAFKNKLYLKAFLILLVVAGGSCLLYLFI